MKVVADRDICIGAGMCVMTTDAVFDQDDDVVMTHEATFACGCRTIQHEYHDGAVSRTLVHHDGRILVDELIAAE